MRHTGIKGAGLSPEAGGMPAERAYGCLFCRTGHEIRAAQEMERLWPGITARAAMTVKRRSRSGRKFFTEEVLIPGYVFFAAPAETRLTDRLPVTTLKLLRTQDGEWQLYGRDAWLAEWLMSHDGMVGMSQARQVGDRIQIQSGPLKDLEGFITKVDRRNRSGQVELTVGGKTTRVWLGFELLNETMPMSVPEDQQE